MKDKHVIGYGIKFSTESWDTAWGVYRYSEVFASKKEADDRIKEYKKNGDVTKAKNCPCLNL